jgi:TetR/AcrR family transcriptional repressor of nem operon
MGRVSDAKERLMEAVEELVWKGSYGSTTIDEICQGPVSRRGVFTISSIPRATSR